MSIITADQYNQTPVYELLAAAAMGHIGVDQRLTRSIVEEAGTKILEQLTDQQVAYMTARIPMGRTGTTEEIAAVVHFLASPDCSFVTGQCYDASWGRATY